MVNYVLLSHWGLTETQSLPKDIYLKDWVETGPVLCCFPQDINFYPYALLRTETEIKQVTLLALFKKALKRCIVYFKLELCCNLSWYRLTYFQWYYVPMPIYISWPQHKMLKPIGKTDLIFKSNIWQQQRLQEDTPFRVFWKQNISYCSVEGGVLACICVLCTVIII